MFKTKSNINNKDNKTGLGSASHNHDHSHNHDNSHNHHGPNHNQRGLSSVSPGEKVLIKHISEGEYKSQLLRLGLYEGQIIECISKLPGGTMVLGVNRQELALGKKLTDGIVIEKIK